MNIEVRRRWTTGKSVISHVFVNGRCMCFGLEPPIRTDDVKPRAIPAGTYEVTIRWSEKHKRNVPHVEKVPGFEEIEIHVGNYPRDTEGCLLVGETMGEDYVGNSHGAFEMFYAKLLDVWKKEPIAITYRDPEAA